MRYIGEENSEEAIATCCIMASRTSSGTLDRQKRLKRYFHMPFSRTVIE